MESTKCITSSGHFNDNPFNSFKERAYQRMEILRENRKNNPKFLSMLEEAANLISNILLGQNNTPREYPLPSDKKEKIEQILGEQEMQTTPE